MTEGESAVDFHIYASDLTIAEELEKLRGVRREARESQLKEEIRQHQQAETSLRNLAANFAAINGAEFFSKVTRHLAEALDLDYVFIAELIAGEDRANAVGGYARGEALPLPFAYNLKDTPCEHVVKQKFCFHTSGVQAQFPKDTLLKEMGMDSYIGTSLCAKDGHVLGLIVGLSDKRLNSPDLAESLFKVFSSRIAVEIERKQAEESLRKLSSAIEQAGESVLITDKAGIIEYVNPAFVNITGYSAEEAIGQTPRMLKSGNQDAAFYASMWQRISSGQAWHGKVIDKRKDGSFFPTMLTISPILNENDEITHYVGLHADLTEQENLAMHEYICSGRVPSRLC